MALISAMTSSLSSSVVQISWILSSASACTSSMKLIFLVFRLSLPSFLPSFRVCALESSLSSVIARPVANCSTLQSTLHQAHSWCSVGSLAATSLLFKKQKTKRRNDETSQLGRARGLAPDDARYNMRSRSISASSTSSCSCCCCNVQF